MKKRGLIILIAAVLVLVILAALLCASLGAGETPQGGTTVNITTFTSAVTTGTSSSAVTPDVHEHEFNLSVCTICKEVSSDTFCFYENSDGTYSFGIVPVYVKYILKIPDSYKGRPVTAINVSAFLEKTNVTEVYMPSSMKRIEKSAFARSSLKKVVFYGNEVYIGESAFKACYGLTKVVLPNGLTYIGESAFNSCISLTEAELPGSITYMGAAIFKNCTSLEKVKLGEGISYISDNAFEGCKNLKEIEIPESVTSIGENAFKYIGRDVTFSVDENNQFYRVADGCFIENESKTVMWGNEQSVIPTDGSATRIGAYAFNGCESLESIVIPKDIIYIGEGALGDCEKLTKIIYLGTVDEWEAIEKNGLVGACTVYCTNGEVDLLG